MHPLESRMDTAVRTKKEANRLKRRERRRKKMGTASLFFLFSYVCFSVPSSCRFRSPVPATRAMGDQGAVAKVLDERFTGDEIN